MFSSMINDWRHQWGQGSLPFLYVQVEFILLVAVLTSGSLPLTTTLEMLLASDLRKVL